MVCGRTRGVVMDWEGAPTGVADVLVQSIATTTQRVRRLFQFSLRCSHVSPTPTPCARDTRGEGRPSPTGETRATTGGLPTACAGARI
jgi:hypothetical protein